MEASPSTLVDVTPTGSQTRVITPNEIPVENTPTLRLNLRKTSTDKKSFLEFKYR